MIADVVSVFNKRAASVLPKTKEEYSDVMSKQRNKLTPSTRDVAFKIAENKLLKRDINWIENNGLCLEKIRPGISTIAGAGRGAFSQVYIEKGEIITPSPLLNIPNKDSLLVYNTTLNDKGERVKVNNDPIGYQLLLNYCFGHEKSKLILCPETNAILINHCSTRQENQNICNGNSPNAKVQWASEWNPTSKDWLEKSLEDIAGLTKTGSRGLSLEVVATRDIVPGEEVGYY